ncbi:hypothetical protein [Ancylobacter sp.]|uniref:hypothetical protein n=1 Tax=Ancylobacter sp. TaxID=1872567 RepID=UPI003BAA4D29
MNMHSPQQVVRFSGVELATLADKEDIFRFLTGLHHENGMFPMDGETVMRALHPMLSIEGRTGFIGVIRGANGIEASIGMTMEPWWYTRQLSLNERWNFVHPDHRRTTHAKRLIEFAKWVSDNAAEGGIPLIMGIISTERTEAKVRLYKRQLDYVGAFFSHGLAPRPERQI